MVPATPDGRNSGDPLSDATLSPGFGMDQKGPTAILKSASKISTKKTYNPLLSQKSYVFTGAAAPDDEHIDSLKQIVETLGIKTSIGSWIA